jgi:uncharacterized protein YtpQ (UPF0354 family)
MDQFCGRAMPYLKADVTAEPEHGIALGHDDSPVLRDFGNGLLVAYVVDCGQSFEYVQGRHLAKASITAEDLHAAAMNNLVVFMGERARLQPHSNIFAMSLDGNFEFAAGR